MLFFIKVSFLDKDILAMCNRAINIVLIYIIPPRD